jgi:protocatechuate 3,4-dioxygenase alpha subunit
VSPAATPSQTIGPFFGPALSWPHGPFVVALGTPGAVWLRGRVLDAEGEPVGDALVETWQADPEGRYPGSQGNDRGFGGFGRCATDPAGGYAILTLKPGSVAGPDGRPQAPHLAMSVFARGLLKRVVTRVYFPEDGVAHAADPVLSGIADDDRRATLVAAPTEDGYGFDVRLQGDRETVFFAL